MPVQVGTKILTSSSHNVSSKSKFTHRKFNICSHFYINYANILQCTLKKIVQSLQRNFRQKVEPSLGGYFVSFLLQSDWETNHSLFGLHLNFRLQTSPSAELKAGASQLLDGDSTETDLLIIEEMNYCFCQSLKKRIFCNEQMKVSQIYFCIGLHF